MAASLGAASLPLRITALIKHGTRVGQIHRHVQSVMCSV